MSKMRRDSTPGLPLVFPKPPSRPVVPVAANTPVQTSKPAPVKNGLGS